MPAKTPIGKRARRFYNEALNRAERYDFPVALEVEGVDQEIAVLRLKLREAMHKHPEDLQLMVHGITLLVRALSAKYRLPKADEDALVEAMADGIESDVWPRAAAAGRDE